MSVSIQNEHKLSGMREPTVIRSPSSSSWYFSVAAGRLEIVSS